jgi:hypothetical protein
MMMHETTLMLLAVATKKRLSYCLDLLKKKGTTGILAWNKTFAIKHCSLHAIRQPYFCLFNSLDVSTPFNKEAGGFGECTLQVLAI